MGLLDRLFPRWRRSWRVTIRGVVHRVAVEWDTSLSGGGAIAVDGLTAMRWRFGVKGIATSRAFQIDGVPCEVRKGGSTFGAPELELLVEGIVQRPDEPGA